MDNYVLSAIEGFMNELRKTHSLPPARLVSQEWHRHIWGNVYEYMCSLYCISKGIATTWASVSKKADNDIILNTHITASAALKELLLQIKSTYI